MARKKYSPRTDITPDLLKFREKRKWQISLRRYVLEKNRCPQYAPYFGLDIESMRNWFEAQFEEGVGWDDFAKKWQFDHIIPVTYFDFSDDRELKRCWNFINIRVQPIEKNKDKGHYLDLVTAKRYFEDLHNKTWYKPCLELLEKIAQLELSEKVSTSKQLSFITANKPYLDIIENYSSFEFELLNSGRTLTEVIKEVDFLKKF